MFNRVDGFYSPRQELISDKSYCEAEMTEWESAFLCGLLKKFRPKKIVEVGVAEGGTTAIIDKCMTKLKIEDYEIHSVDLRERCWQDTNKRVGWYFDEVCSEGLCTAKNHTYYIGKYLPEVIDRIGSEIDFLILDTVHAIPGELLDAIAVLPYLKDNAIILLHDLVLLHNFYYEFNKKVDVNMQIFNVLLGEKFYNIDKNDLDVDRKLGFANIGAVMVRRGDIELNARNLFTALLCVWYYMPDEMELGIYKKKYEEIYGKEAVEYFGRILEMQKLTLNGQYEFKKDALNTLKERIKNNKVIIYGTGTWGKRIKPYIQQYSNIVGFCISDNFPMVEEEIDGIKVYRLRELKNIGKFLIIVSTSCSEVYDELHKYNYEYFTPNKCVFDMLYLLY